MYKSYFKTALRNLFKQKLLTGINILGLSIGIACFSFFLLYAFNEFNYDRFHADAGSIYRVYRWSLNIADTRGQGEIYLPMPLGPAMKHDIAGVRNYVRMKEAWSENFVKIEQDIFQIPVTYADPSFFDIFSFKLISGSPTSVLKDLRSVVLSERTARTFFGDGDPVGRTITIKVMDDYEPFVVTGVAENPRSNSSIRFDILASFEYFATTRNGVRSVNNWNRTDYITYVQLDAGRLVDTKTLQAFYTKYHPDEAAELRQQGRWKGEGQPKTYGLQPLENMHTDMRLTGARIGSIDSKNVWILLSIAGGLLLIACINFTTLAIGRSAGRSKEVGIRKVLGSEKKSLIAQFICEALLLSILSTGVGLLLAILLLPYFNQLSGRELAVSVTQFPEFTLSIVVLSVLVGIFAGIYPALILSGFNPLEALKQKIKVGGSNFFTKSLVIFQFVLSILLIASTSIMLQQIDYMTGKSPGFNKENIMVVNGDKVDANTIYPLFKQVALQQPQVTGVAGAGLTFGEGSGWNRHAFQYLDQRKEIYTYFVDEAFISLMGIQLMAGRNFNQNRSSDAETSVIINEAMVKDFGWTSESAIGQELRGYYENRETKPPVVIGVVKNFHFRSLKEEIAPQLFHQFSGFVANKYFVVLKPGNPISTITGLEAAWKQLVPDMPFRYSFLDEDLDRFYQEEQRWGSIAGWAGGTCIFLASLGLFGLAVLTTGNKIKEIGIRKVLGASVGSIVGLVTKDFSRLVLIALIIALPLAWYHMDLWLQNFVYRVTISWVLLLGSGLIALVVAVLTVGFHVVRVALINPVKNLRTE
jgi:putative ABC transport system permease protein